MFSDSEDLFVCSIPTSLLFMTNDEPLLSPDNAAHPRLSVSRQGRSIQ